jgi:SOS-response transcriptional repressor LexA
LQPQNVAFSPIIERKKDVEILGVVKGVFRYLS